MITSLTLYYFLDEVLRASIQKLPCGLHSGGLSNVGHVQNILGAPQRWSQQCRGPVQNILGAPCVRVIAFR